MSLLKLLILDDKSPNEDFSTAKLLSRLSAEDRDLIDYHENASDLWRESAIGDEIELLRSFSGYAYVFIHDSYEDPLVPDGLKAVLIEKLAETSNVVLFSGSRDESEIPVKKVVDERISANVTCYEILRRQYYNNFANFISSLRITGEYKLRYLYNPYINPKRDWGYQLFQQVKVDLETSIESAIESAAFSELISLMGSNNLNEIKTRFVTMNDDEFVETLEDALERL